MDNGVRGLVDLPDSVTGAELQQMVDEGEGLVSARGIPQPFESTHDGTTGVRWAYVLGAVALTVAGIAISAPSAAGSRRQLVSIGLLSAKIGRGTCRARVSLLL